MERLGRGQKMGGMVRDGGVQSQMEGHGQTSGGTERDGGTVRN